MAQFLVWIAFLVICGIPAAIVYNHRQKRGYNPWPMSIFTFVLAGIILIGILFLIFINMKWER